MNRAGLLFLAMVLVGCVKHEAPVTETNLKTLLAVNNEGGVEARPVDRSHHHREPLPWLTMAVAEGPFSTPGAFCRWVSSEHGARCVRGVDQWNLGIHLGKRGRFIGAMVGRVALKQSGAESCPVLMKTDKGWWATGAIEPCRWTGGSNGQSRYAGLVQFRYADEIGQGVLLVERESEEPLTQKTVYLGQEMSSTAMGAVRSRRYCVAGKSGFPRCSDWKRTMCGGMVYKVTGANGIVGVEAEKGVTGECLKTLWPVGRYRVLDNGEGRAPGKDGPGYKLFGPYSSIDDICQAPPTPEDVELSALVDPRKKNRCVDAIGSGWVLPTPDETVSLLLFDAGDGQTHYCQVALRQGGRWYVEAPHTPCGTKVESASWLERGGTRWLVIRTNRVLPERPQTDDARMRWHYTAPVDGEGGGNGWPSQVTLVRACAIMNDKRPVCMEPTVVACRLQDGRRGERSVTFAADGVTIDPWTGPSGCLTPGP